MRLRSTKPVHSINQYRFSLNLALAVVILVATPSSVFSQWAIMSQTADSLLTTGVHHIYNCEWSQARTCFETVISKDSEHPAGYFMDAMIEWWRINLNKRDLSYDKDFLEKIDRVIQLCDNILVSKKRDLAALFFKGGALGFRGRFFATRESYLSAVADGRQAYSILQECYKIAPGNHDIMLGSGLYNYFAAILPERIPILKPAMVFFPSGDKTLGLLQLQAAARKARYANYEAMVVLMTAYADFEQDWLNAKKYASQLYLQFPRNPYFKRYYGRTLISTGPIDSAEIIWREVVLSYMDRGFAYDMTSVREGLYYVGLTIMMKRQDLDLALRYFYKCDEASRVLDEDPSGFMVKTNIKIGQIYDLQGKRDLSIKQYNKVLSWRDRNGSHDEVRRYLANPYR